MSVDAAATGEHVAVADAKAKAPPKGGIRALQIVTESKLFGGFILAVIFANAFTLGLEAHLGDDNPYAALIDQLDVVFLSIYVVELILEFLAQGPRRYVREGWNWFDVAVVAASFLSTIPGIAALRTMRVFRVLRLISNVPPMKRMAEALVKALPGILAVTTVMVIVFYIGAVMATIMFREELPEQFGDLARSALTLFQLALFDNWGDTIAAVNASYPWGGIFLLIFTILSAFAVLNLFIGVMVDAVQAARDDQQREIRKGVEEIGRDQSETHRDIDQLLLEVRALRAELARMRSPASGG